MADLADGALYVGRVTHRRMTPRVHDLAYRVYWMTLDLDALEETAQRLTWFSLDRFNLFSFRARDYGDGSDTPLRTQVERALDEAGLGITGGRIVLLTMPRVLGYAFNPISVYFCYETGGRLAATLYEVNNTFGQRHSYLFAVEPGDSALVVHSQTKRFHVSPFMPMDMTYAFRLRPPGEGIGLSISARGARGPMLFATMTGRRRALSDGALLRVFFTHPLLTLKVIGGIHWEALRLWLKRVPLVTRPKLAPAQAVTVSHMPPRSTP